MMLYSLTSRFLIVLEARQPDLKHLIDLRCFLGLLVNFLRRWLKNLGT